MWNFDTGTAMLTKELIKQLGLLDQIDILMWVFINYISWNNLGHPTEQHVLRTIFQNDSNKN